MRLAGNLIAAGSAERCWWRPLAQQVASYVRAIGASRGAVVVFSPFRPTQAYSTVRLNAVTEIVAVVIYVGDSDQAADLAQR